MPMNGLRTANHSETRHSAMERVSFMLMAARRPAFVRRIGVTAEKVDHQRHGENGNRVHGRCAIMKLKVGGDEGASVSRSFRWAQPEMVSRPLCHSPISLRLLGSAIQGPQ